MSEDTYSRTEVIDTMGIDFVRALEMMYGDKSRRMVSLEIEEEDTDEHPTNEV